MFVGGIDFRSDLVGCRRSGRLTMTEGIARNEKSRGKIEHITCFFVIIRDF
jgi:hypothetical protein